MMVASDWLQPEEVRAMGDKSPKSTAKTNKQKSQKKDAKPTTTSAPAKK